MAAGGCDAPRPKDVRRRQRAAAVPSVWQRAESACCSGVVKGWPSKVALPSGLTTTVPTRTSGLNKAESSGMPKRR